MAFFFHIVFLICNGCLPSFSQISTSFIIFLHGIRNIFRIIPTPFNAAFFSFYILEIEPEFASHTFFYIRFIHHSYIPGFHQALYLVQSVLLLKQECNFRNDYLHNVEFPCIYRSLQFAQ